MKQVIKCEFEIIINNEKLNERKDLKQYIGTANINQYDKGIMIESECVDFYIRSDVEFKLMKREIKIINQ
jgi:hypothetical protein